MTKKLTITISDDVYIGLYAHVGPGKIGRFLEELARPHVVGADLAAAYAEAAADEDAERAALEWIEAEDGETLPEKAVDAPW